MLTSREDQDPRRVWPLPECQRSAPRWVAARGATRGRECRQAESPAGSGARRRRGAGSRRLQATNLFERPCGEGRLPSRRIEPSWSSEDGAFVSALPRKSTFPTSSDGPPRILARDNLASHGTPLFRRLLSLPKVPMLRAPGPGTRSWQALRALHVTRRGRRGSHFLMYRAAPNSTIEIVRILHDRTDVRRCAIAASALFTPKYRGSIGRGAYGLTYFVHRPASS